MRAMGDITQDLESILEEMIDTHDLQKGEVLALVAAWIDIHRPGAIEEYIDDDSNPVYFYGAKEQLKKLARSLK